MRLPDGTRIVPGLRVKAIAGSSYGHYAPGNTGTITKLNSHDPDGHISKAKLKRWS